jgi:hypothetical protein
MSYFSDFSYHTVALILSAILVYASMFRYIYSIIRGKTKPNVVGWLLYEIATICILISAYELRSTPTIMLALAFAMTQLVVIILAFRYGFARMDRVEGVYFGISMLSLVFWIIARHSPDLVVWLGMTDRGLAIFLLTTNTLIDAMGATAIFTKLYKHPETEDQLAWMLGWLSWLSAVIAVNVWTFEDLIYPIYLFLSNLAIYLLCFRKRPRWRMIHVFGWVERIVGTNWRGKE